MEAYAGEVSPMMCFEADLQVVRASSADGKGLNASRWALAEAAIIADIGAAVEEEQDSIGGLPPVYHRWHRWHRWRRWRRWLVGGI